ncbi:MAG: C40 family peptidase, partial [Chitinophagaceae bacterium]|nr:C40 family peptidase [Chitinophagaceae bacterium]
MNYAMCCVPVSALRKEPSHKSEIVSQLLFGECCMPIEHSADNQPTGQTGWIKVKCTYDNYEGWCLLSHIVEISKEESLQNGDELTGDWINELEYNGEKMYVPLGCPINSLAISKGFLGSISVKYIGKAWEPEAAKINCQTIEEIAYKFLNTTYLWGGKSVFGIDCSGFCQTVYKFLNIKLPRDAWEQAEKGETITSLEESVCGDLAFFDNEEGRITHVGIILNPREIIHSSGKVRVDKIDNEGIENS